MATELEFDVDPAIKREYGTPAADVRVARTVAALEANGFRVLRAADSAEAKRIVLGLIPDGSQVHHSASQSLEASGIADAVEHSGRFDPPATTNRESGPHDRGRPDPPPVGGA